MADVSAGGLGGTAVKCTTPPSSRGRQPAPLKRPETPAEKRARLLAALRKATR